MRKTSESSRLHFSNIVEVDLDKLRRNSTQGKFGKLLFAQTTSFRI